jgi:AcrR family transcriptional regulator
MSVPPRAPRADAVANRARIVDAARSLLVDTGDVPMNAVARAAGVGQGTLYRNFPTREALLATVYQRDVDELVAQAPGLLESMPPLAALRVWFDAVATYARVKRGVLAAIDPRSGRELTEDHVPTIAHAVDLFLQAAAAAENLRAGVRAGDVITLLGVLSAIDPDAPPERVGVVLDVIVDGLRAPRRG